MRIKRISLGAAAVLASAMTALAIPQAQAETTAPVSTLASSPTISPYPGTDPIYNDSGLISCPSGALCTSTWDPVKRTWKIYTLRKCTTYYLSYWENSGAYINNQTGGVRARFYRTDGTSWTVAADNKGYPINWTPVSKIKPC